MASLVQDHGRRVAACRAGQHLPVLDACDDDPILSDPRWKAVATLMDEPWFSRTWVIQEIGLARNPVAVYGQAEFPYRAFVDLMTWVKLCAPQIEARFRINWLSIHLDWCDWSLASSDANCGIGLLSLATSLQCTDPRDHVYAFLGHPVMTSPSGELLITPDYDKPVPLVFRDLAELGIATLQSRWLSLVEHDEATLSSGNASWVNDFDVSHEMTVAGFGSSHDLWYHFAGDRTASPSSPFEVLGPRLKVRSVVFFDVVASVIPFGLEAHTPELPRPVDLRLPSYQRPDNPLNMDRAMNAVVVVVDDDDRMGNNRSTPPFRYRDDQQRRGRRTSTGLPRTIWSGTGTISPPTGSCAFRRARAGAASAATRVSATRTSSGWTCACRPKAGASSSPKKASSGWGPGSSRRGTFCVASRGPRCRTYWGRRTTSTGMARIIVLSVKPFSMDL